MYVRTNELLIDRLRTALAALPVEGEATVKGNLLFFQTIARPEAVLTLIHEILHDPALLAGIARRSYRHVNHFDKILLIDSQNERSYRLTFHLWDPPYSQQELEDELIHDHRFSFWSAVLAGRLVSESFERVNSDRLLDEPVAESKSFRQYRYCPEKLHDTTVNFYEFVGEATLGAPKLSERVAGESYYLNYEKIHRVLLPQQGMTCTLVFRGPRERKHSNVYNTTYPAFDTTLANRPFSAAELAAKLDKLAAALWARLDHATESIPLTPVHAAHTPRQLSMPYGAAQ